MNTRRYHHGSLRRAVLDAALEVLAESGPDALSLRDLARRSGVSHAAPAHHFGDRAGLLTAVATEGYGLFADALEAAGDDLLEMGVAYVRFGTTRRPYFDVMFRPELYRPDDPDLLRESQRAGEALRRGSAQRPDPNTSIAAWSLVHGFTTLWNAGNLPYDDPVEAAPGVLRLLFSDRT